MSFSMPIEDLFRFRLTLRANGTKQGFSFELKALDSVHRPVLGSVDPQIIHFQSIDSHAGVELNVFLSSPSQGFGSSPSSEAHISTNGFSPTMNTGSLSPGAPALPTALAGDLLLGQAPNNFACSTYIPPENIDSSTGMDMNWDDLLSMSQHALFSGNEAYCFGDDGSSACDLGLTKSDHGIFGIPPMATPPFGSPFPSDSPSPSLSAADVPLTPEPADERIVESSLPQTNDQTSYMQGQISTITFVGEEERVSSPPSPSPSGRLRSFSCKVPSCTRSFTNAYTREVHMSTHRPKRKRAYPCTMGCEETFTRKHDRWRHEVSRHGKECDWKCAQCSHFFSSKKMLDAHECSGPAQSRWTS